MVAQLYPLAGKLSVRGGSRQRGVGGRQQGVGDRPDHLPGATFILGRDLNHQRSGEEEEQGSCEKHLLVPNDLVGKIGLLYWDQNKTGGLAFFTL